MQTPTDPALLATEVSRLLLTCLQRWQAHSAALGLLALLRMTLQTALTNSSALDEIDAIGTKRYESQSGGEREIQRTMLELLNQMDGFDSMGDVKVGRQLFACLGFLQL